MIFFWKATVKTKKKFVSNSKANDFVYSKRSNNDHGYKKKIKQVQETKKFNCKAQIVVKEIVEFPDHKVGILCQNELLFCTFLTNHIN